MCSAIYGALIQVVIRRGFLAADGELLKGEGSPFFWVRTTE